MRQKGSAGHVPMLATLSFSDRQRAAGRAPLHRLGTRVRRQTGLGSCSSEEEVSASAQNWPRVQRELLRARSRAETCYFPLSSLFDCHSLRPFSNDWVYLTPTRRQRSSSLGSKKVSAFPSKAASLSPLIQLFLLEQSPVERSTDIQHNVNDQCKREFLNLDYVGISLIADGLVETRSILRFNNVQYTSRDIISGVKFERKWKEEYFRMWTLLLLLGNFNRNVNTQEGGYKQWTHRLLPVMQHQVMFVSSVRCRRSSKLVGPQRQKPPLRFYMRRQMIFSFCAINKLDHALDEDCTYAVPWAF